MKKNYWLFAGLFVGLYTVVTAWFNMNILVSNGDLALSGSLIVVTEYTGLIYVLSLIERALTPAPKAKTKQK